MSSFNPSRAEQQLETLKQAHYILQQRLSQQQHQQQQQNNDNAPNNNCGMIT